MIVVSSSVTVFDRYERSACSLLKAALISFRPATSPFTVGAATTTGPRSKARITPTSAIRANHRFLPITHPGCLVMQHEGRLTRMRVRAPLVQANAGECTSDRLGEHEFATIVPEWTRAEAYA